MASGDTLLILTPKDADPPASSAAQHITVVGGSTPAENIPVIAFDKDSTEYMDWCNLVLPAHYGGNGLTLTFIHGVESDTTTTVEFGAAIRRIQDDAEDIDTSHTYDFNSITPTSPTAAVEFAYDDLTFSSGADMDSLAAGETFILRVRSNVSSDNRTAGDLYLKEIHIKET